MAKRASQAGDARTTDRTSARRLGTELSTCGKRRRWTAEQKHKIVAEGMEPDASAAMVAGRHGISTGQFYAWRQQLLLRGAFGAGADTMPSLAGIDAATSAPRLEPAIPAPPGWVRLQRRPHRCRPFNRATGLARRGQMVWQRDGLDEDCGAAHALTTDRRSVLNSPRGARADCGQADRSGDTAPAGAWTYALRRFRHGDRYRPHQVVASSRGAVAQVGGSWCYRRPDVRARRSDRRADRRRSTLLCRSGSKR